MRGIEVLKRSTKKLLQQTILLGQVREIEGSCRRVDVVKMKLDPRLHMYFNSNLEYVCIDQSNVTAAAGCGL